MNKQELKAGIEKLLESLEQEENNVDEYFHSVFGDNEKWSNKQIQEHEKTMRPIWDAGESLASAIHSLEE